MVIFSVHVVSQSADVILLPLVVAQTSCIEVIAIGLEEINNTKLVAFAVFVCYQATFSLPVQTNWFVCTTSVAIGASYIQYYLWVDRPLGDQSPQVLSALMASRDIFKIVAGYFYERSVIRHVKKMTMLTE